MKKLAFTSLTMLLFVNMGFSQVASNGDARFFFTTKGFNKKASLSKAKGFLLQNVLGTDETAKEFQLTPLASSGSGELTTLIYSSKKQGKEGLILGFYGDHVTDEGRSYTAYAFKNIPKEDAIYFLDKIAKTIDKHKKFMNHSHYNNNVYFSFKDIDVLIYTSNKRFTIRLFWEDFESEWNYTAFKRSRNRFKRKID